MLKNRIIKGLLITVAVSTVVAMSFTLTNAGKTAELKSPKVKVSHVKPEVTEKVKPVKPEGSEKPVVKPDVKPIKPEGSAKPEGSTKPVIKPDCSVKPDCSAKPEVSVKPEVKPVKS